MTSKQSIPSNKPPKLKKGDWIEVISVGKSSFFPDMIGEKGKVEDSYDNNTSISIFTGRRFLSLSWEYDDRWIKIPEPDNQSDYIYAPLINDQVTNHSWNNRPAISHVGAKKAEGKYGNIHFKRNDKFILVTIASSVNQSLTDSDAEDDWKDYLYEGDDILVDKLSKEELEAALEIGRLSNEADCMNDGFIVHDNFGGFEFDLCDADDRAKGLEQILEKCDALGIEYEIEAHSIV